HAEDPLRAGLGRRPLLCARGPDRDRAHDRFSTREPESRGTARLTGARQEAAACCCGRPGHDMPVVDVVSTDTCDRFSIVRCRACGTARTTPAPASLAPYYASDLAATMSTPAAPLFSALRRMQLARELRRVTASGDPGTVVDVGCG